MVKTFNQDKVIIVINLLCLKHELALEMLAFLARKLCIFKIKAGDFSFFTYQLGQITCGYVLSILFQCINSLWCVFYHFFELG